MKIQLSDPVVVAAGPDSRTAGWGPYQFPDLGFLKDGRYVYTFADSSDSAVTYGAELGCAVSNDNGATWQQAKESDFYHDLGLLLPNGDRIRFPELPSIPVENVTLPNPVGSSLLPNGHTVYMVDDFEPGIINKTWELIRIPAGSDQAIVEQVQVNWPFMFTSTRSGVLIRPMPRGRLRVAPDGTLWMPHYTGCGINPNNGGFIPFHCNYLFKSTDLGRTWDLVSWLPYMPDTDVDPDAYSLEGFNENDITFTPDGGMIRLVRSHGRFLRKGICYITRSTDGGVTWTKPVPFDDHGVWPCLLTLKCGVTLASYGRPGLSLRATSDTAAMQWEDPIEVIHADQVPAPDSKCVLQMKTCGYSNLYPLDDHTAALIYSDFTIEDEQGIPRKTMMYRTVTVEL